MSDKLYVWDGLEIIEERTSNGEHWLNRDPLGELGGLNLYNYVANNPINAIDPFGLDASYNVAIDWFLERGTTGASRGSPRNYDPTHQIPQDLMRDEGILNDRTRSDPGPGGNFYEHFYGSE